MRFVRSSSRVASVVLSFHPAYAMKGMGQFKAPIRAVIARAAQRAILGKPPVRTYDAILDPTPDAAAERLARVPSGSVVVVDIETPRGAWQTINLVGFAYADGSMVCRFAPNKQAIAEFLARTDVTKVFHNDPFDCRSLRWNGCKVAWPFECTLRMAAVVWPPFKESSKRKWLALASCVLRVFPDRVYWKEVGERPDQQALFEVMFPDLPPWLMEFAYCGVDVVETLALRGALIAIMDARGLTPLYRKIVQPCAPMLQEMEWGGMQVDVDALKTLRDETEVEKSRLEVEIEMEVREFHVRRRNRAWEAIKEIEAEIVRLKTPDPTGVLCPKHKTYFGFRQPAKSCTTCGTIYVAQDLSRARYKELQKAQTQAKGRWVRMGESFRAGTDTAWRELLFDRELGLRWLDDRGREQIGFEIVELTEGKLPSVDKEVMEALFVKHPQVRLLRLRVDLQHADHRLDNTLNLDLDEAGVVHFVYSTHRAGNGRIASGRDKDEDEKVRESGGGNAQNIPDRDRRIYIADAGQVLVDRDFSQVEARVMAWLAKETVMLEAWRRGIDIHAKNATILAHAVAQVIDDPERAAIYAALTPEQADSVLVRFEGREISWREAAKRDTHGTDYGMMARKKAKMYGIPVRVAQALLDGYLAEYPALAAYQRLIVWTIERDRVLVNPYGRRLEFHNFEWNRKDRRWQTRDREEGLAFNPASTVADHVKMLLPEMEAAAREVGGRLLTTTHDEYLATIPVRGVDGYVSMTDAIMGRAWEALGSIEGFGEFVCPSDVMIGKNWGKFHAHDERCRVDCQRLSLDGVRKVKR